MMRVMREVFKKHTEELCQKLDDSNKIMKEIIEENKKHTEKMNKTVEELKNDRTNRWNH